MQIRSEIPSIRYALEKNRRDIVDILEKVLQRITPSKEEEERVLSFAKRLKQEITHIVERSGIDAEVTIEGSVAKGTWLPDNVDFDIFIIVDYRPGVNKEEFFLEILNTIRSGLDHQFELRYAEHPYLRGLIEGFEVDIAPAYKAPPQDIISSFDRTPHHTKYVISKLTPALANEVRLLKAFLRGIDAYGAEIKIGGLSGYACELLIIYYGSFIKTIEEFANNKRIYVDLTKTWRKKDAFKKFQHHFILVDPTDRNRNVGSALRLDVWNKIRLMSNLFLEKPLFEFFYPTDIDVSLGEIRKILRGRNVVLIVFEKDLDVTQDVYWGQALRIMKKVYDEFSRSIFRVISIDAFETDKYIVMLLETCYKKHPSVVKLVGPPIDAGIDHIFRFYNKHKNNIISGPWIENNRLCVLVQYGKVSIVEHVKEFISSVKTRPSFLSFEVLESEQDIISFIKQNHCEKSAYKAIRRGDIHNLLAKVLDEGET